LQLARPDERRRARALDADENRAEVGRAEQRQAFVVLGDVEVTSVWKWIG
jgi:hypothetical protein